jgi:predicted dehydrogenase
MRKLLICLLMTVGGVAAQNGGETKIAVIGLVHSHVWGHLGKMIDGKHARLVGVAETNPELVAEVKKRPGGDRVPVYSDYTKLLEEQKPEIVWAFVENNRHLEIAKACAPRKIHLMYEKPLASTLADAREIARLAKQHGIEVLTNYQMAWWASQYTAKRTVDAGAIGKPWRLRGVVGHGGPGNTGPSKFFFDWLTDPVQNGGGALMDFGCYNALWSLWYMGRPEKVYAHVNQLRPETFPKVEDNSTMVLSYKNGVGLFEGSWDLPRSFQELEVFGLGGSVVMQNGKVTMRKGRMGAEEQVPVEALVPENADPVAYMVARVRGKKPVEGIVAIDINVDVVEIIEAAKKSVKTGAAVALAKQK